MKKVIIYTDGACSGNPGVGGWGAILMYNGVAKKISGYDKSTTNNRMEMFAVIQALRCLNQSCHCVIYSDSQYVVDAFNKDWITSWQQNNWRTASKSEVKNVDLWKALLYEINKHKVEFVKVAGHAGDVYNELCDEMATTEVANYQKLLKEQQIDQ
ncbi:MAG: ribonuclease HI [Clostridia bacterium]|nr:ribonuclease HI [Clostridia bacterium]